MKVNIYKSPGFYLSVILGMVGTFMLVKALPETWGIKKYFSVM